MPLLHKQTWRKNQIENSLYVLNVDDLDALEVTIQSIQKCRHKVACKNIHTCS
jgi:hypothetical protein